LVRPQIDNTRAINQLQFQVQQDQALLGQPGGMQAGDPNALVPYTGHPIQFMSYSHYFTSATAANRQQQSTGTGGMPAVGSRRYP
jgi:hypothetical protein